MTGKKTILVLNMGMKSIRSILFDEEGNKLAASSMLIETALTGGMVTQDPSGWWKAACQVIREAVADAGEVQIDYLTVTASSTCLVCVDSQGEALMPCMMVSDKRAVEESSIIEKKAEFIDVNEPTGLGRSKYLKLQTAS